MNNLLVAPNTPEENLANADSRPAKGQINLPTLCKPGSRPRGPGEADGAPAPLLRGARPFLLLSVVAALLLAGCAQRYNITLTNNHVITTGSRPKLNKRKDAFVFKNLSGTMAAVPAGTVKQIEPQSHKPTEDAILKPR